MLGSPTLSRERCLFLIALVEEEGVLGDLFRGLKNAWRVLITIAGLRRNSSVERLPSLQPSTPRGWVVYLP